MEKNQSDHKNTQKIYCLKVGEVDFNKEKYKTPFLYETWIWEGDESVLPYKWVDLIKNSKVIPMSNDSDFQKIKEYLKQNYYGKESFDKQSFFFITSRSEVAGCVYLNKDNTTIEYYIVNPKHFNKGVEEGLFGLLYHRMIDLGIDKVILDTEKTNIQPAFFESIGFGSD